MSNLNAVKLIIYTLLFCVVLACNNNDKPTIDRSNFYNDRTENLIALGKKVANGSPDSLKLVVDSLYEVNKLSDNKKALVYAQLYESNYHWQNADHKKAMQLAVKTLANARQFKITVALPGTYYTIANLHKETSNYPMAFGAVEDGLNIARESRDSGAIIGGLSLKAMLTRSQALKNNDPKGDTKSITLNLAALKMAESDPRHERIRIKFYNNIGQYYKDTRQLDSCFFYIRKAIALAKKYDQKRSLTYSYSWLGQATYFKGDHEKGLAYLDTARQIAKKLNQPFRVMEVYEHEYDCFASSGNYQQAMRAYMRSRTMRDSLKMLDNTRQLGELQVKYDTAEKDRKIAELNAQNRMELWQRNTALLALISFGIIGALYYRKEKDQKKLLIADKQLVDEELRNASLELKHFTDSLQHKNELIEEFKSQIEQLHLQHVNKADIENLDALMKAHIMTDENWDTFKKLFTKVHGNFFNTIKKRYPNLTANDNRMLSLIKMQLGNNEMANMLGVTIEGVKKSKQRLRKKMNLTVDENLNEIITAL